MELMKSPSLQRPAKNMRRPLAVLCLVMAALGQAGCGREFFREWANQDVSEVIFEKSRDPRFRIDLFSIDPPAMSRYADPYDPDRPPAPPDDYATQALSPVPQWPDNRLIVPLEGSGYLEMLESYQPQNYAVRDELIAENKRLTGPRPTNPYGGSPEEFGGGYRPTPAPTPPNVPSPFTPPSRGPNDPPQNLPRSTPIPGGPTPNPTNPLPSSNRVQPATPPATAAPVR